MPPTKPEPPPNPGAVADAPKGNWVDRLAPAATRPYLRLSRADRPIGTWLLYIPCLWGLALAALEDGFRQGDLWLALSAGAGAFLMRGAGCTWNDITDRKIDAQVARTRSRPLPSGQVSLRGALVWMLAQMALAGLILLTYPPLASLLAIASLGLVAIYPFAKRFTWWPQAFLGLAFNWGALVLYAAHAGQLGPAPLVLYTAGVAWTLYYDTIYALQDVEDDALIGVKSTARLFGSAARTWLWAFLLATILLLGLAVLLASPASLANLALALAGVWAMGWHMVFQMRALHEDQPQSCLLAFRKTRDGGLLLGLFLAGAAIL